MLYVVSPVEFDDPGDAEFATNESAVEVTDSLEAAGIPYGEPSRSGPTRRRYCSPRTSSTPTGSSWAGVTSLLLGSTVQDVMLSTDRAVTITGEQTALGEGVRTVLIPVDRDENRALKQAEYVTDLPNGGTDVEATVRYVFRHLDYMGAPEHEFAEIDAAVEVAGYLDQAGVSVERVAIGGMIANEIIDTAEQLDVDGIVTAERPVTLTG